jgi:hypothetical protein
MEKPLEERIACRTRRGSLNRSEGEARKGGEGEEEERNRGSSAS